MAARPRGASSENGQKAASGSLPWIGMGGVPLRALEERFAAETDATGRQALLEQSIFTWDGVADLPVVLRMTTWSNACRLQHRQLQHSGLLFQVQAFVGWHCKKTCTYGQNLA